jgi:histidine ammonia-lyase
VKRLIGVVFVLAMTCAPAQANLFKLEETTKVATLAEKAGALSVDVSQAQSVASKITASSGREFDQVICLTTLYIVAENLQSAISDVHLILSLSIVMRRKADEELTLEFARQYLSNSLKYFASSREIVNAEAAACTERPLVSWKAQALLDFMSEANLTLAPFAERLHVTAP